MQAFIWTVVIYCAVDLLCTPWHAKKQGYDVATVVLVIAVRTAAIVWGVLILSGAIR